MGLAGPYVSSSYGGGWPATGLAEGAFLCVAASAVLLNLADQAYRYEDPDHWRLPVNTDKIPYQFER